MSRTYQGRHQTEGIPFATCTCTVHFNTSTVNHANSCPIKMEAIRRLHLSSESPWVEYGGTETDSIWGRLK